MGMLEQHSALSLKLMKMTAAVLEECGKPLRLLDLEIPKLKRGQVLVKIAYSAICRSQLMEIEVIGGPILGFLICSVTRRRAL